MKKQHKRNINQYILNSFLIIYTVIQIYPLFWLLLFSFKDNSEIYGGNVMGLPTHLLWQNYKNAIVNANIGLFFINSIIVTFGTIVISDILACMASFAITRMKWKLSKPVLILFLLGMMIPLHASLLPLFITLRSLKLISTYWALILPYVGFAQPMAIFILSSFLESIPGELEEAAIIDGASIYRIFCLIILPLMKPAIATISIFTFLSAWNELMFGVTFISKQSMKTLTVGILSLQGRYAIEWGPIGAGLVIATLPTLMIYILMSSQVQKSLTSGALKG
ncbi:MAG: carbohydrate ABC transporter permease [Clostridiales bacterium]|nr:carbohydrate ABC transporter permease [Clostridiales bacterium]